MSGYGRGMMDDYDVDVGVGSGDYDEDMQEEMLAALGGRGGQLSQQAQQELFTKKLIHKDFYNDFTDDCDDDDLE